MSPDTGGLFCSEITVAVLWISKMGLSHKTVLSNELNNVWVQKYWKMLPTVLNRDILKKLITILLNP